MADWAARQPFYPENLGDYPDWVTNFGLVAPYGECQCGCKGLTSRTTLVNENGETIRIDCKRCLPSHKASKKTPSQLFGNHVIIRECYPDQCWAWRGKIHSQGYGVFTYRGDEIYAHRFSYEYYFGEIPDGLHVLHKCDNPPCCKPEHLFLGTNADNVADAVAKNRNVRGERVGTAKLTADMVARIKLELLVGKASRRLLGQQYGVSERAIAKIASGETWAHVSINSRGEKDDV